MAKRSTKGRDEALLMALACGATVVQAAVQVQVSERTVYRRLADPVFRQKLGNLRDEMVQRTAAMLRAASLEAVKTLVGLLNPSTPPTVRFSAGRAIVELGMRLREAVEMEDRLKALEAKAGIELEATQSR